MEDFDRLKAQKDEIVARQNSNLAREAVALWMIRNGYATGHGDTLADLLIELVGQARKQQ